jgi:hypothetical protein
MVSGGKLVFSPRSGVNRVRESDDSAYLGIFPAFWVNRMVDYLLIFLFCISPIGVNRLWLTRAKI